MNWNLLRIESSNQGFWVLELSAICILIYWEGESRQVTILFVPLENKMSNCVSVINTEMFYIGLVYTKHLPGAACFLLYHMMFFYL